MATKTPAADPLAGLPVATPKAPRTVKAAGAPAASGNVVNLGAAKAARKRNRLTGDQYKQARDFARSATGYNETSPIWGKRMTEVLTTVEAEIQEAMNDVQVGNDADALDRLGRALTFNQELQKRIATNQVIAAQR